MPEYAISEQNNAIKNQCYIKFLQDIHQKHHLKGFQGQCETFRS